MAEGLIRVVPDILFLVILTVVTRYLLTVIRLLFGAIESGTITLRNFDPEWAKPTYRLVRIAVFAFALVVAYPYIPGSDSDAFKGVSLFLGVLLSLGSTSLIGNIMAGYTLMYRRVFKPGDRVRIGDHLADVERSTAMATYLRTPKNEMPWSELEDPRRGSPELQHTYGLARFDSQRRSASATSGWRPCCLKRRPGPGVMREPAVRTAEEARGLLQITN
jgi:hypothetical protein